MGLDGRERACGSVLEGGEGRVLLQALRKVLGSLRVESVGAEAVNGSQTEASAGPDGGKRAASGVLEPCESPVLSETL